jgi:hypothetical protein
MSLAIKAGTLLGTAILGSNTLQVKAVQFGTSPQLYPATVYPGKGITVRSLNFVKAAATSFTPVDGLTDADATAAFQASTSGDTGGYLPPAGFTTPTGWREVTDSAGVKYLENPEDANGDGVIDETVPGDRSATSFFTDPVAWVKENPVLTISILVGAFILYKQLMPKKGKKKTSFFGF